MMLTGQAASRMVSVREGLLVNFSVSKMLYEGLSKPGSAGTNRHHPAMQQSPLTWKHERQWLPQCNHMERCAENPLGKQCVRRSNPGQCQWQTKMHTWWSTEQGQKKGHLQACYPRWGCML